VKTGIVAIGALLAAVIMACGSSDSGGTGATSICPQDNPNCREAATVDQGAQSVKARNCINCHTPNMAGSPTPIPVQGAPPDVKLYPPNLTSDMETGVGSWTDEQLAVAIRSGIDNDSLELCPQMKHFSTMSDYEVFSIVKYLRSIPAVKNDVPRSVCPPLK
jgi:mono/diheme cytochrome c family protein